MELRGRRVVVVGLGRSGLSAARLARRKGAEVIGTDSASPAKLADVVRGIDFPVVVGSHREVPFSGADLVIVSPGVPNLPQLDEAAAAGVEVVGELEFASRLLDGPLVAVGGTNGKSTVTTLIHQMLSAAGMRSFAGGNLGTPLSEAVDQGFDVIVAEVSSFQLERVVSFHPRVSILLNVTEDHLDRYAGLADYAQAKGNAFLRQTVADTAIIPAGDDLCQQQARRGQGRIVTFGVDANYAVRDQEVLELASGRGLSLRGSRLHGLHNAHNTAAAVAAARAFDIDWDTLQRAVLDFVPLPHRMALVDQIGGVRFYDDSKGTNVGAAVTALLGLCEPRAVLIAGGRDKLGGYEALVEALRTKGAGLVVLGEASERIAHAVGGAVPVVRAQSMSEAVDRAFGMAAPGQAVLLSPACASFDMFRDYADRGQQFVRAVRALGENVGQRSC